MNLMEEQSVEDLADLLYNFLPGSGNSRTAFPLAAATVQCEDLWVAGSKRPAIVQLLSAALGQRRHKFGPLILAIVRQSMTWRRGRGEPLARDEVARLNEILLRLSIKIPELNEQGFLDSLHRPHARREDSARPNDTRPTDEVAKGLSQRLVGLYEYPPQRRGYEYERFLTELFDAYGLTPRSPFKLVGEQIDGSFKLHGETYLVEAKWHAGKTGQSDLLAFAGKVAEPLHQQFGFLRRWSEGVRLWSPHEHHLRRRTRFARSGSQPSVLGRNPRGEITSGGGDQPSFCASEGAQMIVLTQPLKHRTPDRPAGLDAMRQGTSSRIFERPT